VRTVSIPGKVVDEAEARQWLREGRTFPWIVETYRKTYGVETTVSMWSSWSKRRGFGRRVLRDKALIPWNIKKVHDGKYLVMMLRGEARRRAGISQNTHDAKASASFVARLKRDNLVVAYDPGTVEGFRLVPRLPCDTDIIRQPPPEFTPEARRLDHGRL
jgi:hypothetical protein